MRTFNALDQILSSNDNSSCDTDSNTSQDTNEMNAFIEKVLLNTSYTQVCKERNDLIKMAKSNNNNNLLIELAKKLQNSIKKLKSEIQEIISSHEDLNCNNYSNLSMIIENSSDEESSILSISSLLQNNCKKLSKEINNEGTAQLPPTIPLKHKISSLASKY